MNLNKNESIIIIELSLKTLITSWYLQLSLSFSSHVQFSLLQFYLIFMIRLFLFISSLLQKSSVLCSKNSKNSIFLTWLIILIHALSSWYKSIIFLLFQPRISSLLVSSPLIFIDDQSTIFQGVLIAVKLRFTDEKTKFGRNFYLRNLRRFGL